MHQSQPQVSRKFLSEFWFKTLQTEMMSWNFPWYLLTDVAYEVDKEQKPEANFGFSHKFFSIEDGPSAMYGLSSPLVNAVQDKFNIDINELLRVRAGLYTNMGGQVIHSPHVDFGFDHKVVLFYVYGDGPTYFYKLKDNGASRDSVIFNRGQHSESFEMSSSIEPVENSAILFDGSIYHSSSSPVLAGVRIVISINFR